MEFNEFQQRSREHITLTSFLDDSYASDVLNVSQYSAPAQVCTHKIQTELFNNRKKNIGQLLYLIPVWQMLQRIRNVQYRGDPHTLPAQSNEIEFLVRIFYKLATHINEAVN